MPIDHNLHFRYSKRKRPLILVTNDDGVQSRGIRALVRRLKSVAEVVIVAPVVEQSATSHTLTLHRPLRLDRIERDVYAVDGSPTDCITLALNFLFREEWPDIIFSGINCGPNMGDDIHYSGTVSAAIEGGIVGIPSVAVSVTGSLADALSGRFRDFRFDGAACFCVRLARKILSRGLPKGTILNVNVPNLLSKQVRGYKFTFQGKKNYSDITTEKMDPRGRKYYWISGVESGFEDIPGSDCNAVHDGFISITPIRVNLTDNKALGIMKRWKI